MEFKNLKKFWNRWGYLILLICTCFIFLYFSLKQKEDDKDDIDISFLWKKKRKRSSESKGETECRKVMESIYGVPFIKIRPKWMMNPATGKNLELDVYNADLKIAIEYQGAQHLHYNKYFHKSELDFKKQQERDEYKRKKCKEFGITLIEVPYTVDNDKIKEFLINELKKNGKF